MRLRDWFGGGSANSTTKDEIKELTNQFHITLRASLARVQGVNGGLSPEDLKHLKELLQPGRNWSEAYEVEQMLVQLYDKEALKTELEVRCLEAGATLHQELANHYDQESKTAATPERQRSLLARLINDLQWRYTVNEVKRRYSQDITSRTAEFFALALALFVLYTVYIVFWKPAFDNVHLLILAGLAGAWGATFSMLGSLKRRLDAAELDALKLMRPWIMLLSRALIGAGAGCVLLFFIRSGLLGGDAFPKLENLTSPDESTKALALLTIWCFIAGFSERLVPGILEKTEGRVESAASVEPHRFRPEPNGGPREPEATKPIGDGTGRQGAAAEDHSADASGQKAAGESRG